MKLFSLIHAKITAVLTACLTLVVFAACQTEVKQDSAASDASQENPAGKSADVLDDKTTNNLTAFEKYFQAGNKYSRNGEFPESIESYRQALAINDAAPSIHYNLANVLVAMDKIDAAVEEYQRAIELNPLVPDYHRNLGFAYALQKKEVLARKKYEELMRMAPAKAEELRLWIQKENQGG